MAKERHQYGPWRALADLNLVYGPYSSAKISPFSPTAIVGNPRFDRWFANELDSTRLTALKARLSPSKKTLLYLPTWEKLSSVECFGAALASLTDEYNLITKVHHNTDALELSRRSTLTQVGIETIFGATDDLLYLLSAADIVVSDFSGAIFDAIYVRKPVLLLQKDAEKLVNEKFGLESIEYARRDMIGPVAQAPSDIHDALQNVFDQKDFFAESNAKLRKECFTETQNCGEVAATEIKNFLAYGADRPHHQLYLRDFIRKTRAALEDAKAASNRAAKRRIPALESRASKEASGSPAELAPTLKSSTGSDQNKWLKRILTVVYKPISSFSIKLLTRQIELRRKRSDRTTSVKPIPIARILSSRQLATLAQRYNNPETEEEAVWLSRLSCQKSKLHGLNLYIDILARYHRVDELAQLLDEYLRRPIPESIKYLFRMTRAQEALKQREEELRVKRQQIYQHIIDTAPEAGSKRLRRYIEALIANRWLETALQLSDLDRVTERAKEKAYRALLRAQMRMGAFYLLTDAANHNIRPNLSTDEYLCFYRGELKPTKSVASAKLIEFFLPQYFYGEHVTDPIAHDRICALLRKVLTVLVDEGFAIIPRHQFRLTDATPLGVWPTLSYHTTGDAVNWWHIKDAAFPNYFSIDPKGFAGWSSISDLRELPPVAANASIAAIEENWTKLQENFVHSKRTKYQQSEESFAQPTRPFIFVPLQLLNDAVAQLSWISGIQLAQLVINIAPALGFDVVLKRHPKCTHPDVEDFINRHRRSPRVIITNARIHDLLQAAAAVVTVNSGVGFEALLYGKKVITTGRSDYQYACELAANPQQLEQLLASVSEPVDIDKIKRFLWYYFNHYAFSIDDVNQIRSRILGSIKKV